MKSMMRKIDTATIESIKMMMRKNYNSVGFIPITSVKRAADRGQLIIRRRKFCLVGYLLSGPIRAGKQVSIWQVCVKESYRGKGIGSSLFFELMRKSRRGKATGIRLRCAADLPSNRFWVINKFDLVSSSPSKNGKREINEYSLLF